MCRTTEIIPQNYRRPEDGELGIIRCFEGNQNIIQIIYTTDFLSEKRDAKNQRLKKKETIQEYYFEGSLQSKLLQSIIPIQGSVRMGLSITRTLREIHEEGVLHLDLKPGNILLRSDENGELIPVIIDFGLSRYEDQEGRGLGLFATEGFRAPWYETKYEELEEKYKKATDEERISLGEQLDSLVTKDLDIYSLSVILVGGEISFQGKNYHLKGLIPGEYINPTSPFFDTELAEMIFRMQMSPEDLLSCGEKRITLDEIERILESFYTRIASK